MALAIKKIPSSVLNVFIITDSLSLCTSVDKYETSIHLKNFLHFFPTHLLPVRLVWVPGRTGTLFNETADSLAGLALDVCPNLTCITAARFRRYLFLSGRSNTILDRPDYSRLNFKWNSSFCLSRQCEVSITAMRCRLPKLSLYLSRSRLAPTDSCLFCDLPESLEHYLFYVAEQRKTYHCSTRMPRT